MPLFAWGVNTGGPGPPAAHQGRRGGVAGGVKMAGPGAASRRPGSPREVGGARSVEQTPSALGLLGPRAGSKEEDDGVADAIDARDPVAIPDPPGADEHSFPGLLPRLHHLVHDPLDLEPASG